MYLIVNGQRIAKKKTHVKKRTLNPVFNESFVFEIPSGAEGLGNVCLEFLLLDWDRVTKNEVCRPSKNKRLSISELLIHIHIEIMQVGTVFFLPRKKYLVFLQLYWKRVFDLNSF